jgi:hypothetical protein
VATLPGWGSSSSTFIPTRRRLRHPDDVSQNPSKGQALTTSGPPKGHRLHGATADENNRRHPTGARSPRSRCRTGAPFAELAARHGLSARAGASMSGGRGPPRRQRPGFAWRRCRRWWGGEEEAWSLPPPADRRSSPSPARGATRDGTWGAVF